MEVKLYNGFVKILSKKYGFDSAQPSPQVS